MNKRNLLLLSTSTIHGSPFLAYCLEDVKSHFEGLNELLFVPYARPSGITHDEYTNLVREKLQPVGIKVKGLHEMKDPKAAIRDFGGIYVGGGNTFLLLKSLYESNAMDTIRDAVRTGELRYMGSSAGTNVACAAINNTNDMPIVYPPSFNALGLVSFHINPHYLDPDPDSTHKGETRETRIREFQTQSQVPVVGLREGSWLKVNGTKITLHGSLEARIFEAGKDPYEVPTGTDLSFLD